jgi:hypothetical protein
MKWLRNTNLEIDILKIWYLGLLEIRVTDPDLETLTIFRSSDKWQ